MLISSFVHSFPDIFLSHTNAKTYKQVYNISLGAQKYKKCNCVFSLNVISLLSPCSGFARSKISEPRIVSANPGLLQGIHYLSAFPPSGVSLFLGGPEVEGGW